MTIASSATSRFVRAPAFIALASTDSIALLMPRSSGISVGSGQVLLRDIQ